MPPRLPPRSPSPSSSNSPSGNVNFAPLPREDTVHLTPHSFENYPYSQHANLQDSRRSSTQSLRPTEEPGPYRRTLLIVYIHGFLGDETSFRSFPAHVHSLLTMLLAETHVVHSKVYPKYKSRKNVSFARDAFSNWLSPHESATTDTILIGHSLGGIVGAEVILMPSPVSGRGDAFKHRIFGLIAFDTPFLGMSPSVVGTGIASLFRGAPEPSAQTADSESSLSTQTWKPLDTTSDDPNFNPAFTNDIKLPVRGNKWEQAWYFWNKHCGDLRKATQSYVKSHLEFGGVLADYPGLKRRYDAIRPLEDIDDLNRPQNRTGGNIHRVRFVNYYTASTGRIKETQSLSSDNILTAETEMKLLKPQSSNLSSRPSSESSTPYLSLDEYDEGKVIDKTGKLRIDQDDGKEEQLQVLEPLPYQHATESTEVRPFTTSTDLSCTHTDLPPIPPEPITPEALEASLYTDRDALRLAEKENSRQVKAYEKAKKDRRKAIKDREKVIAKRERQAKKEQDRLMKTNDQGHDQPERGDERKSTTNLENIDEQTNKDTDQQLSNSAKPKKERRFCTLPSRNKEGQCDPTWIRVYMEGMDEVVAHTSLFFVSDAYAKLVSDTVERIEGWVKDNASVRMILSQRDH